MIYIKAFCKRIMVFTTLGLALALSFPLGTEAASSKPTCSLAVSTSQGEVTTSKKTSVFVLGGDALTVAWQSKNAKTALDEKGQDIAMSGSETNVPEKNTTYSYTFKNGSSKAVCTVVAIIGGGTIDPSSLVSLSGKPTLEGTASGSKTVQVVIREEGSLKEAYSAKTIKVKNGTWAVKVSKKLPDGAYDVVLFGSKDIKLNTLATGKLLVGKDARPAPIKANTTLVVSPIALLTGGIGQRGASVPISYLQITNIGKEPATLKGFWVKQDGSAPIQSVIGLSTVDDRGQSRIVTGGFEGGTPFQGGLAFAATSATLAPGELRLFTIKAILSANSYAQLGNRLMIDVTSLDTDASVQGQFPIAGTTWIIQ